MLPNKLYFLACELLVLCVSIASTSLCSNKKSAQTCVCKRVFNDEKRALFYSVDCSALELNTFPEKSSLDEEPQVLDLSFNNLEHLDEADINERLIILNLSYNKISEVSEGSFRHFPNLTELYLAHNRISLFGDDYMFGALHKLSVLDLSFNKLKTIPDQLLAPLRSLRSLDLSYNNLSTLLTTKTDPLAEILFLNENLTTLKLNNIGLREAGAGFFSGLGKITHLSLADNFLETVPDLPPTVEFVDLSGNLMSGISTRELTYRYLKELRLNRLLRLTHIPQFAFYHLPQLEKLYITDCPMLKTFGQTFGDLVPRMVVPLKELHLERNGLRTLNASLLFLFVQLDYVDVSNNPWVCDCNILWLQDLHPYLHRPENIR